MKLLNYDLAYLVETQTPPPPKVPFSKCQFQILCKIIRRKNISREYFYGLIKELYGYQSVYQLSYEEMYRVIWVLNHWGFLKYRYENQKEKETSIGM